MNKKAFISYSVADKAIAVSLARELNRLGNDTFLDARDFIPGENWEERLKAEIKSSSYFVPVISPNFVTSYWSMQELGAALALGIKIIPILVEPTQIPINISKFNFLDLTKIKTADIKQMLSNAIA